MNTAEANRQAFEIWYRDNPTLTVGDLVSAGVVSDYYSIAQKVFFSDAHEFTRWTITSGFKDFLDSRSDDVRKPDDWEDCQCTEPSERQKAEEMLKALFRWMQNNEKQLTNPVGFEDPNIHVLAHALINGINIEAAEEDSKIGTQGYTQAKSRVYSLLYGGK